MYELYLFIFAALAITAILIRRHVLSSKEARQEFKDIVSTKVEENRKKEKEEMAQRFKEKVSKKKPSKSIDLKQYRQEMAQADLAMAKGEWDRAKKHLIQAIALKEEAFDASLKLAMAYMESADLAKAENLYHRLMENHPEIPEIYENLGRIMAKKKNYKQAIQFYVRAVEIDEKDPKKFMTLGKLYHLMMRYSIAAECFRRAAELKPRDVESLLLLAQSCRQDEDYENALFAYERVLTLEPYNEKAKDASAEVKLKIKEYENTIAN